MNEFKLLLEAVMENSFPWSLPPSHPQVAITTGSWHLTLWTYVRINQVAMSKHIWLLVVKWWLASRLCLWYRAPPPRFRSLSQRESPLILTAFPAKTARRLSSAWRNEWTEGLFTAHQHRKPLHRNKDTGIFIFTYFRLSYNLLIKGLFKLSPSHLNVVLICSS